MKLSLEPDDFNTETWRTLRKDLETELFRLREENDSRKPEHITEGIRARIRMIKRILRQDPNEEFLTHPTLALGEDMDAD